MARIQPQSLNAVITGLIDPKRTEYGGVTMRSRLEVAFARHLDSRGIQWRYEPAIYGDPGEGYLPDFQLYRPDGWHFVEIKPTLAEVPRAQERMAVIWARHPTAVLIVACAEGSTWFACEPGGEWRTWVERWAHG